MIDAGFKPNDWNSKTDTSMILNKFAELTIECGHIPTKSEIDLARRADGSIPSSRYVVSHFGRKAGLASALINLSEKNPRFSPLKQIVAEPHIDQITEQRAERVIDGWVYLLKSGDNFKIGRSDNLERRVKQISVVMPETTNLFHAIQTDDPVGIEGYWHNRFADRRQNGEWFKLTKSDITAFKRRKFQ